MTLLTMVRLFTRMKTAIAEAKTSVIEWMMLSAVQVREDGAWKDRMQTWNITPAPAATKY
jgi:hypothetical protein